VVGDDPDAPCGLVAPVLVTVPPAAVLLAEVLWLEFELPQPATPNTTATRIMRHLIAE
jgi:hypothetical protein